ncbi:hypothetical protein SCMU_14560 [Sinomonas cyclohexanicum]|uniref:Uncharacterized protein n=2 Tax=Sinomonas cyclohexanicum TaxID=322009 RepID=A0ABN6FFC7_SINCY|nr:hypothetical protein SCMU_14560 [Corynebacterium cyclohexanicum]
MRSLTQGVRRKADTLEQLRARVERRIRANPDAPVGVVDWWRRDAAALDFAIDFIDSHPDEAKATLRRRRTQAGTL